MMRSFILGSVIIGLTCVSSAAIESVSINEAKTLREKLTGVKPVQKKIQAPQKAQASLKKAVGKKVQVTKATSLKPAQKGLILAREAKAKKDYILAIKRYNFILKYFAKTPEAKIALMDKADIYKDMGLEEQAQYNKTRAQKMTVQAAAPAVGNKLKK